MLLLAERGYSLLLMGFGCKKELIIDARMDRIHGFYLGPSGQAT